MFRGAEHIPFAVSQTAQVFVTTPILSALVNVDSLATWNVASVRSLGHYVTYIPAVRNIFLSPFPKWLECSSLPLNKLMVES